MRETLEVLNRLVEEEVIRQYAIGGAVAAIYYLEPFATSDVDVFVQVETCENELMIFAPLYEYLTRQGFELTGEFVNIEGFSVQFLPVFNSLTDEAVSEAQTISYDHVTTRIMRAEHLVAIMLDTGRSKDYARIHLFLEQAVVNVDVLNAILLRHGLTKKWAANEYRFKL